MTFDSGLLCPVCGKEIEVVVEGEGDYHARCVNQGSTTVNHITDVYIMVVEYLGNDNVSIRERAEDEWMNQNNPAYR